MHGQWYKSARDKLKSNNNFAKFDTVATITNFAGHVSAHKHKPFKSVLATRYNSWKCPAFKKMCLTVFQQF